MSPVLTSFCQTSADEATGFWNEEMPDNHSLRKGSEAVTNNGDINVLHPERGAQSMACSEAEDHSTCPPDALRPGPVLVEPTEEDSPAEELLSGSLGVAHPEISLSSELTTQEKCNPMEFPFRGDNSEASRNYGQAAEETVGGTHHSFVSHPLKVAFPPRLFEASATRVTAFSSVYKLMPLYAYEFFTLQIDAAICL